MPTQRLPAPNVRLEYERFGHGPPLLVVSPSWWPLAPWHVRIGDVLARDFEVVLFNHRGVGGSDAPEDGYSVGQFASDAAELARSFGLERVHTLGFAIGGATTLVLARDAPELVASATVVAAGGPTPVDRLDQLVRRVREAIAAEGYERYMRSHALNAEAFSPEFAAAHPDVVGGLAAALWQGHASQEVFLRHAAARTTYDFGDWIKQLQTPLLVAVGAEDHAARGESTPVDMAQQLAKRLPNARLWLAPQARHMLPWECAEALAEQMRALALSVS
jgi:pimeloyl-ACP methyl ester carboxylesterase